MNKEVLRKYAKLVVCSGVNIQPGQMLWLNGSVEDAEFVTMCVEEAYKAGAGNVQVEWSSDYISKLHFQNCSLETLTETPQWAYDKRAEAQAKGCARLSVGSGVPGYFSDVDPEKMKQSMRASRKQMAPLQDYYMSNHGQWSVCSLPSVGWAKLVFPDDDDETALAKLWEAILKAVRVSQDNDPIEEWKQHDARLRHNAAILTSYQFKEVHFRNGLGTDLHVGLVKNHIWVGGSCFNDNNVEFNPNIPTEEIFNMPDRNNVNGKVYASMPLSYGGKVIRDFWFEFKDGIVVDYDAKEGKECLDDILNTDEGSRHLGEVALISNNTPISQMGILFYNTLFDENASCHLALGACYPENVVGGTSMTTEEILALGGNDSLNHVDFMFGTADMSVVGIKENGEEVVVFEDGNFVI